MRKTIKKQLEKLIPKLISLIERQKEILNNPQSFIITLEDLEKQLQFPKAHIHRAFMILKNQLGWSILPFNYLPYGRKYHLSRNRKKGESYYHDWAEPDWERTKYKISFSNKLR